jgi:hypothetical protein
LSSTPLTDVKIRQAKASAKPVNITDANGLLLRLEVLAIPLRA